MITPERIAELRALLVKATPRPWYHMQPGVEAPKFYGEGTLDWVSDARIAGEHQKIIIGRGAFYGGADDYALVCAAVATLPDLLDAVEGAQKLLAPSGGVRHVLKSTDNARGRTWTCILPGCPICAFLAEAKP